MRAKILISQIIIGAIIAITAWCLPQFLPPEPVTINNTTVPPAPTLSQKKIRQGDKLYAQYCAKCHGENLEGAPNWKQTGADGKFPAPPHDSTRHTWHHPDDLLISIISEGSDPTFSNMPGYNNILSIQDIVSILEFIKSSWGQDEREFQWWVTSQNNRTPP